MVAAFEEGPEGAASGNHVRDVFVPLTVSFLLLIGGLYLFLRDWAFFETGQLALIGIYLAACGGVYFFMSKFRLVLAILMVLVCGLTAFFSQEKYGWRKAYIQDMQEGNLFALELYIENYPSYEGYLLAPYTEKPDWVRFSRACIEPFLQSRPIDPVCGSFADIEEKFHINVPDLMEEYRMKMEHTARQIHKGALRTKRAYESCIASKTCAEVPLLPKDVDADTLDPASNDHLPVRTAFHHLINSRELGKTRITPELCDYITVCQAMLKSGAMGYGAVR